MTCFYHLAELDGDKRTRAINHMECIMGERDAKKAEDSLNKAFTFMKMRCLGWVQRDYVEQWIRSIDDEFSDFFLRYAFIMLKEDEDGWIKADNVYRDYVQCVNDYFYDVLFIFFKLYFI